MFAPDTGATGWSMRTILGVAVVMLSVAMFAQMPVGGTFSNVQAQPVQYGTPVMSPPIVSLGNGLTPTVITNRQPYVVGAPQFVAPETPSQVSSLENPEEPQTPSAGTQKTPPRKRFDFVVTSGGVQSGAATGDTRSLVEVAATTRKSRVAPAEGKAYTNDDVSRMNQKYGMRPQAATPTSTDQQAAPTQNPPAPAYANPPKK